MSNRLITQVASDIGFFSVIIANQTLNKLDRILVSYAGDTSKVKVLGSNYIPLFLNSKWWIIDTDTYVDLDDDLDTSTKAAGTDYYVYACDDNGSLIFLISANSTYPSGYSASTSRKIGGFHTLCVNVGTISGHTLTGLTAESVLPDSVWDLKHRPICEPEGMVYCQRSNVWVDIYLMSTSITSVYNGTIFTSISCILTEAYLATKNKKLLSDPEFFNIAYQSNEETNVVGSAAKTTTGGWSDTAGQRMISEFGCEDCCGLYYQWLSSSGMRLDDAYTSIWYNITAIPNSGSFFTYGTTGLANVQSVAGGSWALSTRSGTFCRYLGFLRNVTNTLVTARGCCDPL